MLVPSCTFCVFEPGVMGGELRPRLQIDQYGISSIVEESRSRGAEFIGSE